MYVAGSFIGESNPARGRAFFWNHRIAAVTQAWQPEDFTAAGRDSKCTGRIPIQMNGAGIMANTHAMQDDPSPTEHALPQSTALTDEEISSVAAGDGGPHAMPLCGIKPSRRAATQKYIDEIKEGGGEVYSYDLDTGVITFDPGPGIPAPEIADN